MVTNQNQPLTDDEIAALLDESASEALRRRVENNVDYQRQVDDARFEAQLGNILYRYDCPTAEELSDYYLNIMEPVSERNIKAHIDMCSACQTDIMELEDFLQDREEQKIDTGTIVPLHPKVATINLERREIRGSTRSIRGPLKTVTAEANGLHIALTVSEDKVGVQVNGQLVPSPNWEAAMVELRSKGDENPHITTIDDAWQFRFQQIETAVVDISLISTEGNIVRIENIKLTEK